MGRFVLSSRIGFFFFPSREDFDEKWVDKHELVL